MQINPEENLSNSIKSNDERLHFWFELNHESESANQTRGQHIHKIKLHFIYAILIQYLE
ncbi:hypothetical protein ES332_D07G163800v1 [Gossypium tomentosum]|uniref:Uncharacterized protein n=1 Tax=Gossypium tomentosum TaxID=34277 RepID=A0A5D2K8V7_GOSTO|nr:hypothetical protein ES332_D07G163800v1 [Gossypium tomentosum]